MKKVIALFLALAMCFALAACTPAPVEPTEPTQAPEEEPTEAPVEEPTEAPVGETYEIAMITDIGTIDDQSFNQGTWEGIVAYAEANKITHKYYQPTEQSNDAYLASIQIAVENGAKIIVTPGFLFQEPIYIAQDLYPNVTFVLIDGVPANANFEQKVNDNAVGIVFAEEQVGYLAGYAAVKDGMTKIGFMGGMAVPAVVKYGYGFVQGAEAAAAELDLESVELQYHYTGGFDATPEAQALAASWYNEGTEVIFAAGGAVGFSVFAAAEAAGAKSIGVDVDQSFLSDSVITSAMKGISASVEQMLTQFYEGTFPGGQGLVFDASNSGVSLAMETAKFTTFSQADYDALFAKLAAGEVKILKDTDVTSANELGVTITKVTVVE